MESKKQSIIQRDFLSVSKICELTLKSKIKFFKKDIFESNSRLMLNFGHTFGHAIEAHGNYKKILHGEAVAKGMLIASRISYLEGHISQKYLNAIEDLLEMYEFDLSKNQYQYKDLKPFIFRDKKVRSGKLNLVLLGGPSKAIITNSFDSNNLKKSLVN